MVDVEVMLNRHLSHQSLAHQLLVYDAGQSSTDESQERSVAYRHLQLRVKPDVLSAKLLEEQCESIYDFSLFVVYLFLEARNISGQKPNICEPARAFITPMLIDGFRYESFSDVGEIRVWLRADFQSGSRVLKKVF